MRMRDANKLRNGLYTVWWRGGGKSLVAVGRCHDGTVWLAPTNWVSADKPYPRVACTHYWRQVVDIEVILTEYDMRAQ